MLSHQSAIDALRSLIIPLLALTSASFVCRQAAAEGEFRALLVGVSAYENALSFKPLLGPANDVALMKATLLGRGFSKQNIVMLADRSDAAGRPTRDAIIQELDRLAESVERDDIVLIHLAGHGSQQPNGNPDEDPELDGLDEIFLPADAGLWVDETGTVSNAIVDDEIATKLAAIRERGAFVFFVSDSCHAEASTRAGAPVKQGVPVNERSRDVKPEKLEIPNRLLDEAKARASRSRGGDREKVPFEAPVGDGDNVGGFVAFYAAQSTEAAPEMPLPPGAPDADENWYGLFSFNLASVLASSSGTTYRQVFEQILQSYRADNRFIPTPIPEGPDLDRLVFGGGGIAVRQWPIATDGGAATIPAGQLHQVSEGTIVAIVPNATTVDESDFLGYGRVVNAEVLKSSIEPVDYADRAAPAEIPAGAFARIVDSQFETRLAVALAERPAAPPAADAPAWRELDQLRTAGLEGTHIEWVPEAAPSADLRLLVRDGRLWFLPPSGELVTEGTARTPALTIPGEADEAALSRFRSDLEDNLGKVARVTTLFAFAREAHRQRAGARPGDQVGGEAPRG